MLRIHVEIAISNSGMIWATKTLFGIVVSMLLFQNYLFYFQTILLSPVSHCQLI